MYFKGTGTIVFDPKAGKAQNPWWVIIDCDPGIIEYYSYWIYKKTGIKVNKPLFSSHISVIRGEEPPEAFKEFWGKRNGETIEFSYSHNPECNEDYWWLSVDSEELKQIRRELGLSDEPEFGFHLTIGRILK